MLLLLICIFVLKYLYSCCIHKLCTHLTLGNELTIHCNEEELQNPLADQN